LKILAGTLRERNDQRRKIKTTVQEKKEPGLNKVARENCLLGIPAATNHCVMPVKKTKKRGGTRLYLTKSYILLLL